MPISREKRRRYGKRGFPIDEHVMAIHEWNIDAWGFELYLVGEPEASTEELDRDEPGIEFQMASRFIKNIRLLSREDKNRPILVHMKSRGGYWTEGMAIYDAIKKCPNRVTILSYTHARSMTSIILQAADKRVLMPHSYFMFHEGASDFTGTYKQVQSAVMFGRISREQMLDIYVDVLKSRGTKFARWEPTDIREKLIQEMNKKEDVYLTAKEAVSWGFADAVFDGKWENLFRYYPRKRGNQQ